MLNLARWISFQTLLRREIFRIFRIWTQTLLPSPITVILYFLVFGHFMGARVGLMNGVTYPTFIAPGLIMMAIINNSYANTANSFFVSKFARNIEELFVSSMSPLMILLGFCLGAVFRGVLVGILVTIVALWFIDLQIHNIFYLIAVVFLTAMSFSLMGLLNGIYARSFDDVNIIPTFVLTPLIFLGGTFYSLEVLSPFWQKVSHLNPIFSMVNVFRYSLLGFSDVSAGNALFFLTAVTVFLFWYCRHCLVRGVGIRA